MKHPLVSIIVPVYNVEKYIRKCLDSILDQTYTNWECILVDDGSPDNAGKICEEYASRDSRIKYFKKKNGGVSSARNLGLKHISGEWVTFVDADDQVYPYFLETLLGLTNDDCDSVCAGYVECDLNGNILYSTENVKDYKYLTYKQSVLDFFQSNTFRYNGYVWNRMFRVSVIRDHNLLFNENIYYGEDGLFAIQFISRSNKNIPFSPRPIYIYNMTPDSALHQLNRFNEKYLTMLDARILILNAVEESMGGDAYLLHVVRFKVIMSYYYIVRDLKKIHVRNKDIYRMLKKKIRHSVPIRYYCLIYFFPFVPMAKFMLGKKYR